MKKHILVISQYFYPEQFRINDICREWVKRGYKVTVVTGIPNYPQGKFYSGYGLTKRRKEKWEGIDIIRIPLFPRGHTAIGLILNYLSFVVSGFFWNIFNSVKADMVFIFEVSPMTQALVGIRYARKHKVPCDMYVQDLWPENVEIVTGIHNRIVISQIEKMVHYIYNNCRNIYATSESFVEAIKIKVESKDTNVIYWPQYAEEFYYPIYKQLSKEQLIVMFTGNIGKAQGLDVLIGTAKLLKDKCHGGIKFVLVGDGREREELHNQIVQEKLEDYFEFKERVAPEEIPEVLANGDIAFVSFMDNELFAKTIPAKLQSYLACGKPVIASAMGETEKIIREAGCGYNCRLGRAEELAQKLIEVHGMDKEKLRKMGENGRKYYEKNFDKRYLMDCMERYIN